MVNPNFIGSESKIMNDLAFFVSIPHSGTQVPEQASWLREVPDFILNCDVDFYIDEIYEPALQKFQIPSVYFPWHRYAVDANRSAEAISFLTVDLPKPTKQTQAAEQTRRSQVAEPTQNSQTKPNQTPKPTKQTRVPQAKSPSDVHWHKSTQEDLLMPKPISLELHNDLIQKYFMPFHQKIKNQFDQFKKKDSQQIYLLDLHSMPSQGLKFHTDTGKARKDIVLGTCEKTSSHPRFIDLVFKAYKDQGFDVVIDQPYRGGFITQTYGKKDQGQNTIQVEINRSLYMDETTKNKHEGFFKLQNKLQQAFHLIVTALKTESFL